MSGIPAAQFSLPPTLPTTEYENWVDCSREKVFIYINSCSRECSHVDLSWQEKLIELGAGIALGIELRIDKMAVAMLLATTALPPALTGLIPLRIVGLGRYAASPAIFLADGDDPTSVGRVLPVPVPLDAVVGLEQALSGMERQAMMDVLFHCRVIANRDDGLFDSLPWDWNPSTLAKRDAFARFQVGAD